MRGLRADRSEIQRLLGVADRELADAGVAGLSPDGSFEHAYAAALALATVVIRAGSQRVHGPDHHRKTLELLASLAEARWADLADYLQHCRTRRNRAVYDAAGVASEAEAVELREQVTGFAEGVKGWLGQSHQELR